MSGQIRQFDRVYCFCNDEGQPISDPCMTIEEAEKVKTDWDLMKDLEMESLGVVADWAEKKAEALGRPRKEILAIVGDWRIGDNGTGDL